MLYLVSAIMWLAPWLPPERVKLYADLIHFEARWYKVDPLLVVSVIQIESGWRPDKRSVTSDYGLMQVHVAVRGSSNFLRRERELLDPRVNVREGTRILAMWREYHTRWCHGPHAFWAHYKWGKKVKHDEHAQKVKTLLDLLRRKFRPRLTS